MTFDNTINEVATVSSDRNDLALSPVELTLKVKYQGAEFIYRGSLDIDVVIIDPCIDIVEVIAEPQTYPPQYLYDGDFTWTVDPVYTIDYNCVVVYSCQTTAGPVDICSINALPDSTASFDAAGSYILNTIDMASYPAGDYTLSITGTVGNKSASTDIVVTLVDPCPNTLLTIVEPDPFEDDTYVLRAAQKDTIFDLNSLITRATLVDCGPLTMEWFNDDESTLDPELFYYDTSAGPAANKFSVLYSQNTLKKGSYPMRYKVYHNLYPGNVVE